MIRTSVLALALFLAGAAASDMAAAQAPDPPNFKKIVGEVCGKSPAALDCFADSAAVTYALCGMVAELAVAGANDGHGRFRRCVNDAKTNVVPSFDRAKRETKTKDAADLLKDSYAYWQTAIDELLPKYDEARLIYRQRLARQKETVDHKLNRLKLEK